MGFEIHYDAQNHIHKEIILHDSEIRSQLSLLKEILIIKRYQEKPKCNKLIKS